jgi:uncharacterized membrane protein
MTEFLMLAFLFFIGSMLGWVLEVFYRRFSPANKARKWINPGFLTGPYLPLYGFGLMALYLLASLENTSLIKEVTAGSKILLFIVMAIVMTIIEYIAGLIFIKGLKVKLWDYSKEKFNLQGIICLRFSIYWALLSAIYYFFINPYVKDALSWFAKNITFSFFLGIFYGILLVDLGASLGVVRKIREFAIKNHIMIRYEELKLEIRQHAMENMEKKHWLLQFKSEHPLAEHLERHLQSQVSNLTEKIEKQKEKESSSKESVKK